MTGLVFRALSREINRPDWLSVCVRLAATLFVWAPGASSRFRFLRLALVCALIVTDGFWPARRLAAGRPRTTSNDNAA